MDFIAHIRCQDKRVQSVETHLTETAAIAKLLAGKLDLDLAGELLGLMHDFGKYSSAFQEYIRLSCGLPDWDKDDGSDETAAANHNDNKKIDHSTAGAQWVYRNLSCRGEQDGWGRLFGQMLSLCIASHHGQGLIDCLSPEHAGKMMWMKRLDKDEAQTHLPECETKADAAVLNRAKQLADKDLLQQMLKAVKNIIRLPGNNKIKEFYLGCLTRFLFSCLIDADRINSADFEHQNQAPLRRLRQKPDWQAAIDKLEGKFNEWAHTPPEGHNAKVLAARRAVADACLNRAADARGIYTLTVPTGGGKTLASLRYALHHAKQHSLERIIYIIPYTSIIDQNADAVRKILGDEWVLEHHCNLDPAKQTFQNKLLSENWDKPIVFSTMVQFLDAWFGGGTRGARHIHPMTNSILIFDEIQTLPVKCVHLFCNVLNWLVYCGKSSAVLCTATQPLLDNLRLPEYGQLALAENAEIMGNNGVVTDLFNDLSRVKIHFHDRPSGWSVEDAGAFLLERFQQTGSCLFIVNTKHWACRLYRYCQQQGVASETLFHLSTHQCPAHRKALFKKMRERLHRGEPVLCVSTQLIEAGVDISMACVIRALAGLDSIAQAAGRCNRHGERKEGGLVDVLNLQNEPLGMLEDIRIGQQHAGKIFRESDGGDILQPEWINRYFQNYFYERSKEMAYQIPHSTSGHLLDWLSDNAKNVYSEKNAYRLQKGKKLLLMQSFRSSGKAFRVIDAPTRALIVPYGRRGDMLITRLCGEYQPKAFYRYLRWAQRYSIAVFPNVWERLCREGAVYEIDNTGIYYLNKCYYSQEHGLSFDETGTMDLYIA